MKKSLLAVLLGAVMVCVGACGKTQEPEAAKPYRKKQTGRRKSLYRRKKRQRKLPENSRRLKEW